MARKKKEVNQPSDGWPKMNQGTHLTVKTFEDGHTELVWDDEQLAKEVREAIEAYELSQKKPAVRAKAAVRRKKDILNSVEESMKAIEKAKKSSKKGNTK